MRHPLLEAWLSRKGCEWEYLEAIPLETIDIKESRKNLARLGPSPLNEELIATIQAVLEDGGDTEAPIIWSLDESGRFKILDGNNRDEARRRAKQKTCDAYRLLTPDISIADGISWAANGELGTWEGQDKRILLEHAIQWIHRYSKTHRQAAAMFGIGETTISTESRARAAGEVLRRAGVRHNFSRDCLAGLNKLRADTEVLVRVAQLAAANDLPAGTITTFRDDVCSRDTHDARLKAVERWEKELIPDERQAKREETIGTRTVVAASMRIKFFAITNQFQYLLRIAPTREKLQLMRPSHISQMKASWEVIRGAMEPIYRG